MWMPIILLCYNIQAQSCVVLTRNYDLLETQEECNKVAVAKGKIAFNSQKVYYVKPLCQKIIIGHTI